MALYKSAFNIFNIYDSPPDSWFYDFCLVCHWCFSAKTLQGSKLFFLLESFSNAWNEWEYCVCVQLDMEDGDAIDVFQQQTGGII